MRSPPTPAEVRAAAGAFDIAGDLARVAPLGRGRIHDTWVSTWRQGRGHRRFVHQRINEHVFRDVPALMAQVERVCAVFAGDGEGGGAAGDRLRVPRLVPARAGASWARLASGAWRTFVYEEGTCVAGRDAGPDRAREAGRAFGAFQERLARIDPGALAETIPGFLSAPHRLAQLDAERSADRCGRTAGAVAELDFVDARRAMVGGIEDRIAAGAFPRRPVHGDGKLDNVLFDERSGRARCVVDLDTCMAGWSLFDFGDLVRSAACSAGEEARDPQRVALDVDLYTAIAAGYLQRARAFLTAEEIALLPFAARLVTLMLALRFLADHLAGDEYFGVTRPGENLERARVQLALLASMEEQSDAMARAAAAC